jgi:hypothetical protein
MSDQDFRDMTYWKATRLNGTDFRTGTVDYAAALTSGVPVTVAPDGGWDEGIAPPTGFPGPGWLHMATVPTECVGMSWPCRLFEVEPADDLGEDRPRHEHKVGATSVRVLAEVDARVALGPQGVQVAACIERCATLTADEVSRLNAAWDAAWGTTWDAAWDGARVATRGATRDATRVATRVATRGAAARDAAWDAAAARDAAWEATRDAAPWDAAWGITWDAAWGITWDAAWALLLRDLIGRYPGWDQGAYDLLTGPWRQEIGPIHPDDAPMAGSS